jgi:hypothetical protein
VRVEMEQLTRDAAWVMAKKALPADVDGYILGELADHIVEWLTTFGDDDLAGLLPIWMGEEN